MVATSQSMSIERSPFLFPLVLLSLGVGCSHAAPDTTRTTRTTHSERESTGAEVRHDDDIERPVATTPPVEANATDEALPTAMDQSSEPGDVAITRAIREAVEADGDISVGARSSVVIITRDAHVTLRGVSSDRDRSAIDAHAHHTSGVSSVDNHITVSP